MNDQSATILPFLRPALGVGEEPPGTGDWLSRMVPGTRFLAKRRGLAGSEVDEFVVSTDPKTMPVVLLAKNINSRDGSVSWHDPKIFCRDFTFYMTIEILEPRDGNTDKIRTEPVVSDVEPKDITGVHEEE